jgi:hypothetical protein
MKNLIKTIILLMLISGSVFGQKYMTKNGKISFYSDGQAEKIQAINNQAATVLDITSGEWAFKLLMKSFEFEKALMQEHFNENYVESNKFPNASFKGKLINLSEVNFNKNGKYKAVVEGDLTIHGVTKKVKTQGNIEVKEGKITANAKFPIALKDYDVKIPSAVVKNIAETVEITVDVNLDKVK